MTEVLIVLASVLLNGVFAAVEMAFVSIGKPFLRELSRQGNREARRLLVLRENPERTLSVIQIGITLVGAIGAAVGGMGGRAALSPYFQTQFGWSETTASTIAIVLIVLPLTYFSVVVGELLPKAIAIRHSSTIALRSARWLMVADRLMGPVVTLLEISTRQLLRFYPRRRSHGEHAAVAEKVQASTEIAEQLSELSQETRKYVINLVAIEKRRVRDIFVPWAQVVYIDVNQSMQEVEAIAIASGHTRLPVLREGTCIGILNTKEFVALRAAGGDDWTPLVRPAVQVLATDFVRHALMLMQQRRSHLALVYAGPRLVGIITMEDILEEVVGDIFDEDDDGVVRRMLSSSPRLRSLIARSKNPVL